MAPEPKESIVRKRRNRRTVVCTNCRKRKSKCDKDTPCNTCKKYGDSDTCVYVASPDSKPIATKKEKKTNKVKKTKARSAISTRTSSSSLDLLAQSSLSTNTSERTSSNNTKIPNLIQDQLSEVVTSAELPIFIDDNGTNFVDFIPSGHYLEAKRSATTIFSLFTDISMEHRDPYLTNMIRFRSIAIKKTMNKFQETTKIKGINPNLPNSFIPLSTFDRDDIETNKANDPTSGNFSRYHKQLFEKFAKYRKDF